MTPCTRWICLLVFLCLPLAGLADSTTPPKPAAATEAEEPEEQDEPIAAPAPKPDPSAAKFWEAIRLLRTGKNDERSAGIAALKEAADLENVDAQLVLANVYLTGSFGISQNKRKAANLFRLAAERGNGFAMVSYGVMCYTGTGIWTDEKAAMRWLTAATGEKADFRQPTPPPGLEDMPKVSPKTAEGGVAGTLVTDLPSAAKANAHFILGLCYLRQKKYEQAQVQFVAGAVAGPNGNSGSAASALNAAAGYAFGRGTPRNAAESNRMIEQFRRLAVRAGVSLIQNSIAMKMDDEIAAAELADQLNTEGSALDGELQLLIANELTDKKSKNFDPTEAVKWYTLAAESGQTWGMIPLAFAYLKGDSVPADPVKAFHWFEKAGGGEDPKHYLAAADLAICHFRGIGTPQDREKARQIFQKFRRADFLCYLGSIGEVPAAPLTFEEALALNQEWARRRKNPDAQFFLGVKYRFGWGVEEDYAEAERWIGRAAKAGNGPALCMLGTYQESESMRQFGDTKGSLAKAVDYYRRAADAGDAEGTLRYATLFNSGRGVALDLAKADALYRKASELDPLYAKPHYCLGLLRQNELAETLQKNDSAAADRLRTAMIGEFEKAAKLGSGESMSALGVLFFDGILVQQDYRVAYRHLDDASANGMPGAHFGLGYMHEEGLGVPVTYAEAAYHYRLAALEGHLEALRHLVNLYIRGQGVSRDLDRAMFWLSKLAAFGDMKSILTICDILLEKGAWDQVIPLLKEYRSSDDLVVRGFAYQRLSVCYERGNGVKADPKLAKKYFDLAVKYGDGSALTTVGINLIQQGKIADGLLKLRAASATSRHASYALGMFYYNGDRLPKDDQRAFSYLRAAAEQNHPGALYFLASLTEAHAAGAPSIEEAIEFARRAEAAGNAKAGTLREALEKQQKAAATTARP